MATKAEVQDLLRFLTQDAKIPLKDAMGSIKALQTSNLTGIEALSKASIEDLTTIFGSARSAKSVLATAKRMVKKRGNPESTSELTSTASSKRRRSEPSDENVNPDSIAAERSLLLPTTEASIAELEPVILQANRAPLVLAFAIVLLAYTYPNQPLSSRLSLAQAIVSANSRSKAVAIGLESGPSAEAEGWAEGQPRIKIMGREISVLRRWNYENPKAATVSTNHPTPAADDVKNDEPSQSGESETWTERTVPLWGLDIEKLRDSNKNKIAPDAAPASALPIFTAQAARNYLLRSFSPAEQDADKSTAKKLSAKEAAAQKEHYTALLLQALDTLFASWKDHISRDQLDRRAWSWYVAVRPDVETGQKGWGEKGKIKLSEILKLRRTTNEAQQSSISHTTS